MFGTRVRPRRPLLLVVVFGAFLAIIGMTATAQSLLVGAHFSTSTLNDIVGADAATTRAVVNAYVRPADMAPGSTPAAADRDRLETALAALVGAGEILHVELRRPDGTIVAASDRAVEGRSVAVTGEFAEALDGTARAAIGPAEASGSAQTTLGSPTILREFLPISVDGEVLGVVGIWRDAVPILARLDDVRREVVLLTLAAALVAAGLLFLIFRTAQSRLSRQTTALMEATRRDPLTELVNHGALVALLADEVEAARSSDRPLGIALIDIDNFRPLNEHHGHDAGDAALVTVADALAAHVDSRTTVGRFGPDEFLLIAPPAAIAALEPTVERVRAALADVSLHFAGTDRLPVTVSVGIATFPDHGGSVITLLSAVTSVLEEAKASGGDAIRVATSAVTDESGHSSTFDVFQGLIIAVDTKDRYTKRHSEDVARYGSFLAERLGLPAEQVRTIATAGLLHDVGKIGIPDHVLRKPGRLTEAEYAVVKQHVALGDMIVRDLPDIDQVRAGIRHHHERWDGDGYLDHLDGEEIPLIARILAVADTFSAMTTTRPYRKAFGVREALERLGDAAGTQLDERLVLAFIDGIEHADDPPLPGESAPGLWLPGRWVA